MSAQKLNKQEKNESSVNWELFGAQNQETKKNEQIEYRIFVFIISGISCENFRATDNIIGHDGSISNSLAGLNDDGSCLIRRHATQR